MNNYKRARLNNNLAQKQVAHELGITQATISEWESGKTNPSHENLIKLTKLYSCTADFLLGITDRSVIEISNSPDIVKLSINDLYSLINNAPASPALSDDEAELLRLYRLADSHSKDIVRLALSRYKDQ